MTPKIAIWYHCLFYHGDPLEMRMNAMNIVMEQWEQVRSTGLEEAASEIVIGINGTEESAEIGRLIFPKRATLLLHGAQSKAENLTLVALEEWVKTHPDYAVLYFHAKGCTHPAGESYGENVSAPWRRGMMADLVGNWRQCVADLASHDIACSHWMWNMADGTQHIPAGNFLWATSNFIATLPSIFLRDRIKVSGIASAESRYEAEVYWGNGPRPNVRQYRPNGGGGVP